MVHFLRLNAVKSINYIKKCFKEELQPIKFPTKNSMDADIHRSQEWSKRAPKITLPEKYLQIKNLYNFKEP